MINYDLNYLFDESSTRYNLILYCPTTTERLDYADMTDAWEWEEGLTDSAKFAIGECLPSKLTVHIVNNGVSHLGYEFNVGLVLNDNTSKVFDIGKFTCYEETLEDDRRKRKLVFYDLMHEIVNADMTAWYNSLTFPMTMANFRNNFFHEFGIVQTGKGMTINDTFRINKKTIDGKLTGKEIVEAICEIKGCFGHISRDGRFNYTTIGANVVNNIDSYKSLKYESYQTRNIGIIKAEFDGISSQYGATGNVYSLEHDLLIRNHTDAELKTMMGNMYNNTVKYIYFVPAELEQSAKPYLELGDRITATHRTGEVVKTVVMHRMIRGAQALTENISSKGDEVRAEKKSIQQQVAATAERVGSVEADNVNIHGSLSAQSGRIDDLNTNKLSTSDLSAKVAELGYATIGELDAQKARIDQLNANKITADQVTADLIQSRFLNPNAGTLTMGTIRASTFQWFNGTDYVTLRFAADGTVRWK